MQHALRLSLLGLLILFLTAACSRVSEDPALTTQATLTVTNLNDSGPGSLRQAIAEAESGDTITFASNLAGETITLTSQLQVLGKILTIEGPSSAGITLSGGNTTRVFYTRRTPGPGGTGHLTLQNVTIRDGYATVGAGILVDSGGALTLINSTITNNTAEQYGGGINAEDSSVILRNSTLSGNTAVNQGGGGIYALASSVTLEHATVAFNSADYGGGIVAGFVGDLTFTNSIVANNAADPHANCYTGNATFTGVNLSDVTGCGSGFTVTEPLLGPLQDYGGPTMTHALQLGSPAINRVFPGQGGCGTTITEDQRGVIRPQGFGCDVGAFELAYPIVLTVTNTSNSGPGSLREAVAIAPSDSTITFAEELAGQTITLTSQLDVLGRILTIEGPASAGITLNGGNTTRIFYTRRTPGVGGTGHLILKNLTIRDGYAADSGGGILVDSGGALTISHSTIAGNVAERYGGGIYAEDSSVSITNSTLSGNVAFDEGGGGIYAIASSVRLENTTVALNYANYGGGIVAGFVGQLSLINSIIANNLAGIHDNCYIGNPSLSGANLSDSPGCSADFLVANPLLGPLQDNGGPTVTHALLPGSPAIDAALACNVGTDQRYVTRPQGAGCDIGAFELELTIVTDTLPVAYLMRVYQVQLEVVAGLAPLSWSSPDLHLVVRGLSLTSDGRILGRPLQRYPSPRTFTVYVTDANGNTTSKELSLTVR